MYIEDISDNNKEDDESEILVKQYRNLENIMGELDIIVDLNSLLKYTLPEIRDQIKAENPITRSKHKRKRKSYSYWDDISVWYKLFCTEEYSLRTINTFCI